METRKCQHCKAVIPSDKRADSKFCSSSCKANYWEKNKHLKKVPDSKNNKSTLGEVQEKPINKPLQGLRGVIDNSPKNDVTNVKQTSIPIENKGFTPTAFQTEQRKETQAYKDASSRKEKAEAEFKKAEKLIEIGSATLENWKEEYEKLERLNRPNPYKPYNTDIIALEEYDGEDNILAIRTQRIEEIKTEMDSLSEKITELKKMLPSFKKKYEEAEFQFKNIVQYETVPTKENSPLSIFNAQLAKKLGQQNQEEITESNSTEINLKNEEEENQIVPINIQSNSKLITSQQLREIDYKCLNFQGKWKVFFGLPAVVFHFAVHGLPGGGKSTFCIQLADYLAKNFGHVVYISGEEGFSKTLKDKVVNNKINNPYLFFADIKSYEQIKNEIPNNQFHFIFIDSLDTLKIDALRLRELREYYPQSAFITISQSTKDGKMRGSQEIIHDTDIAAQVIKGVAVTTKNRYKQSGVEFQVFNSPVS